MKILRDRSFRNFKALAIAFAMCSTPFASSQESVEVRFMTVDDGVVAFADLERSSLTHESLPIFQNDWVFTVSREPDRQVLRAQSGDKLVTQTINPNAVHKRFVFDLKRQRFEPMSQEIQIENTDQKALKQIEELTGVAGVKRYQNLGFSIVKVNVEVNPVEVLHVLREEFKSEESRILTGFFDDEPM